MTNTLTMYWCDRGSVVSFSANTWNHIVCTVDSSNNGKLYLNGSQSTTWTDSGRWTTSLVQLFVCRSSLGSHNSIK